MVSSGAPSALRHHLQRPPHISPALRHHFQRPPNTSVAGTPPQARSQRPLTWPTVKNLAATDTCGDERNPKGMPGSRCNRARAEQPSSIKLGTRNTPGKRGIVHKAATGPSQQRCTLSQRLAQSHTLRNGSRTAGAVGSKHSSVQRHRHSGAQGLQQLPHP